MDTGRNRPIAVAGERPNGVNYRLIGHRGAAFMTLPKGSLKLSPGWRKTLRFSLH